MAHVWSRGGYQQVPMAATAHVPHAQGCCSRSLLWPASAACRETPWDRLPELGVARGRLPGQVAPQVAARTSLSGMWQLAAPPGFPGQFSTAQASCAGECAGCRVLADQVRGHCGAEGRGELWRWLCPQAGQGRWGVRVMGQVPLVPRARAAGDLRHPREGHRHSQWSRQVNVLV